MKHSSGSYEGQQRSRCDPQNNTTQKPPSVFPDDNGGISPNKFSDRPKMVSKNCYWIFKKLFGRVPLRSVVAAYVAWVYRRAWDVETSVVCPTIYITKMETPSNACCSGTPVRDTVLFRLGHRTFIPVAVWTAMKRTELSKGQAVKRSEQSQTDQCPKFYVVTWNACSMVSNENSYGQQTRWTDQRRQTIYLCCHTHFNELFLSKYHVAQAV